MRNAVLQRRIQVRTGGELVVESSGKLAVLAKSVPYRLITGKYGGPYV